MKNILIVGNGFDLLHGLNTSYSDFINLCKHISDSFSKSIQNMNNPNVNEFDSSITECLYSLFLKDLDKTTVIKYITNLYSYINRQGSEDKSKLIEKISKNFYSYLINTHENIPLKETQNFFNYTKEYPNIDLLNIIFENINQLITSDLNFIQNNIEISKKNNLKNLIKSKIPFDMLKIILNCKNNYWLKYIYQNDKIMGEKWCDLEHQIELHIESLSFIVNNADILNKDFDKEIIKNKDIVKYIIDEFNLYVIPNNDLYKKVEGIIQKLKKELDNLTLLLEIYLLNFIDTPSNKNELFDFLNIDCLLSFNYTDTYQKLYKPISHIHYIHGYLQDTSFKLNNMVFGIGKNIENTGKNDNLNYVSFQKYFQRIIKNTGNEYISWLDNSQTFNIYIYGHSLDVADGDIIKTFVSLQHAKIIIFYYDHVGLENIVLNLIKILGKDSLISLTCSDKIHFIQHNENISLSYLLSQNNYSYLDSNFTNISRLSNYHIDPKKVNLSNTNLNSKNFSAKNMCQMNFKGTNINEAEFESTDLSSSNFDFSKIYSSNFSMANLSRTNFSNSFINSCKFNKSKLDYCYFDNSSIQLTKFNNSNLNYSIFIDSDIDNVDLSFCNLSNTIFRNSSITNSELCGIHLYNTIFETVKFKNNTFNDKHINKYNLKKEKFRRCSKKDCK